MKPTLARKIFCIAALSCAALWSAHALNLVADSGFEASADGPGPHPFSASWTEYQSPADSVGWVVIPYSRTPETTTRSWARPRASDRCSNLRHNNRRRHTLYHFGWPMTSPGSVWELLPGFLRRRTSFCLSQSGRLGYTQFTIQSGGNKPSTALEFVYNHNNDFWRLDDVSSRRRVSLKRFQRFGSRCRLWALFTFLAAERGRARLASKDLPSSSR